MHFLNIMFNKFGVQAKVLTNQGIKFQRVFQDLCEKALIDHQTTSRDHPEADRLAKQMV